MNYRWIHKGDIHDMKSMKEKCDENQKLNKVSITSIVKSVMGKHKGLVTGLFVLIVLVVVVSLTPAQLLRIIIDQNLNGRTTDGLGILIATYLLVLLLIGGLDFIKGWMLSSIGQMVIRRTRSEMMAKTERISLRFFTDYSAGEVTSRFTTDAESINTLFADGVISMVIDSLKIVGILISILMFSWKLALLTLCLIPIVYVVTRTFQKNMKKAQMDNLVQLGKVSGHITESIENVQMVKLFSKEDYMEEEYGKKLKANYATRQKVNFYDSAYAPVIQMIKAAAITVVVLLSSKYTGVLGISAGMLAASLQLISDLLLPIESLGMKFQNIQQGLSGITRINEFLGMKEEEKDESLTLGDIFGKEGVSVTFENVSFSYEEGQKILDEISFRAEPHTSVTLAGRTGVGKTTLMNMMMGFLEPDQGHVWINGYEACRIPDQMKKNIFGYVEQAFQFVPGTVKDQITLGNPDISMSRVIEVCKFVGMHDYISEFPEGYETDLGVESSSTEGRSFSYGQQQLLSIARALVYNPPVLLLDEITANLDSATENHVIGVLNRACEDRTIISISHRKTSMVHCDQLIQIENGRVVDM